MESSTQADAMRIAASQHNAEKSYWLKKLEKQWEPAIILPDKGAGVADCQMETYIVPMPASLVTNIEQLADGSEVRLHTILLAAGALLLRRYMQSDHFVLGTTIYRQQHEGRYINTVLPLRMDFDNNSTFRTLLQETKNNMMEAASHQNYPIEILLNDLKTDSRKKTGFPLFDVALVFQNMQELSYLEKIPLNIIIVIDKLGAGKAVQFRLRIIYNKMLYEAAGICQLASHYMQLLQQAMIDLDQPVDDIDLMDALQRMTLIKTLHDTPSEFPYSKTIAELFTEQARRSTDHIAVYCKGVQYTYGRLAEKTEQLAGFLQASHILPGDRVAILLHNSCDFVIAIMAILKCGAVYVPVSPAYPANRIDHILHNSEAKLLITSAEYEQQYTKRIATLVLDIKAYSGCTLANEAATSINSSDLAYIIYTSGSTGVPKGVMVSHKNVINLVYGLKASLYDKLSSDHLRVAQLAPFEFDASVQQIFCSLLLGHTLYIVSDSDRLDGGKILSFYREHSIDLADGTPSHIRLMLESAKETTIPATLRQFIIAGEVLPKNLVQELFRKSGDSRLQIANLYGPTEACVDSTIFPIDRKNLDNYTSMPIGKPLPNQYVYVLDEKGRLQPPGLVGELYIGGEGVAKGYSGLPGLTDTCFLPDPFRKGGRMYRTGDYGKWNHAGNLEFLGRRDDQVKINGYRIELDEIAHHLGNMEGIYACNVAAIPGGEELRLTAYLVPDHRALTLLSNLLALGNEKRNQDNLVDMPSGLSVFCVHQPDARELFNEVFRDDAYYNQYIRLGEKPCIVDVGANIGMFSILIHILHPDSTIYAFEPIPAIYQVLEQNRKLYGMNGKAFNIGMAAHPGTEQFTFYPHSPAMSGMYAAHEEETMLLNQVIGNSADEIHAAQREELLAQRLVKEDLHCRLTTLSEFIASEQIANIDLLKIDVEKSEWDVLQGIDDSDWTKIRQLIIEVHDIQNRLAMIKDKLEEKGYKYEIRQDAAYKNTVLYNVFAWLPEQQTTGQPLVLDKVEWQQSLKWKNAGEIIRRIRAELGKKLPRYMHPQEYMFIHELPLMSNGKVNKKALYNSRGLTVTEQADEWTLAGEMQWKLRAIWSEVLKKKNFGPYVNFFDIGGNSIKAIQVASRIHHALKINVSLTDIFNAPTIVELATRLSARREKEQLEIVKAPVQPWYPLSGFQRRFYSAHHIDPSGTAYNLPGFIEINGPLDKDKLERSFRELIRRHESLRTAFIMLDEPMQHIYDDVEFAIDFRDLSSLPENAGWEQANIIMDSLVQPFNLAIPPLLRVGLIKLAKAKHILLMDMPHIISDGFSQEIFMQDLVMFYKGEIPSPLTLQYKDYSTWESSPAYLEKIRKQEQYWLSRFQGKIPELDITTDFPRSGRMKYTGEMICDQLDHETSARLQTYLKANNVTFYVLMLSFYNILLSKLSRQDDIIVGTPIAGRKHPDLEKIIGAFVNTLAIRSFPNTDKRFRDYLQELKSIVFAAFENQDYQFEKLVEAVAPNYQASRANPLFSAWFAIAGNTPGAHDNAILSELTFKSIYRTGFTTKFELSLTLHEGEEFVSIFFNYNTELYTAKTIEQFIKYYKEIIVFALDHPDFMIGEFEFLSTAADVMAATQSFNDIPLGF